MAMGAVVLSAALALGGWGWEIMRFGASTEAGSARVERDARASFAKRADQVRALAEAVSAQSDNIASAISAPESALPLFNDLNTLIGTSDTSVTVYSIAGGVYRVLAWSDGPAENLPVDRLDGPAKLVVVPGVLGLRLVYVQPIQHDGRRIGVAAAETILSSETVGPGAYQLDTPFGAVEATGWSPADAAQPVAQQFAFVIDHEGVHLLSVRFSLAVLDAARRAFRQTVIAIALLPLALLLALGTGPVLDVRARSPRRPRFWWWSIVAAILVAGAATVLAIAIRLLALGSSATLATLGFAALGLVAVLPLSWWRRPHGARQPTEARTRFALEQLAAGAGAAALLFLVLRFLSAMLGPDALALWQFPLFPFRFDDALRMAGLLLVQAAAYWAMAATLAVVAERWRLSWRAPRRAAPGLVLWLSPLGLALLAAAHQHRTLPRAAVILAALTAMLFALWAAHVRRRYRRTTQASRLALLLLGLLAPSLIFYPIANFYATRTAQQLVEWEYAPSTAGLPTQLVQQLTQAEADVDRLPSLIPAANEAAPAGTAVSTPRAFAVWNSTVLSRTRATSALELYNADRVLTSRFALNVPEYGGIGAPSQEQSCHWQALGEVVPFGAEERQWLHTERGLCDANGVAHGSVVIHVMRDYRALPFVASGSPYFDVVHANEGAGRGSRIADLQVVVYGWSLAPVFTSGTTAWPLTAQVANRLVQSREPFWETSESEGRTYRVHFSSDRSLIYAVGYPTATAFDHLARLSATVALGSVLFVVLLLAAALYAPLARRRTAPVRALIDEVRTSFYRKLFLYFVISAVGPVIVIALAFGTYMADRFRADVQSEAASVVTAARRLLEEFTLQERPDVPLTDEVMVSIGQIINQDVNLFHRSELVATSQRDLFDSGLLPTRTPAGVYRQVALNRLPSYVEEDRIGSFRYLAAAAPVTARGGEDVLSVPLALRQRELDRELDALDRGVLVAAVFVVGLVAILGVYIAGRISDPVSRLSRATRQIAAGRLDVRIVADTADELRRLVDDFNTMAATLRAQQAELARTNQLKAWAEMARQVAHEIKNPLTPIQLAAEHLQRVHADQGRPLGRTFDQCIDTILRQVRLLRQIAGEFSNYAAAPTPQFTAVPPAELLQQILQPYAVGLPGAQVPTTLESEVPPNLPPVWIDRTLISRAITNVIENALQAMPAGGALRVSARADTDAMVAISVADSGVGMDEPARARAFEPYFSTKTAGSGLGLPNARRNVELCGGTMTLASAPGAGTTITIRLRCAAPSGAPSPA
jgi:signal transduction histidine kinase